MQVVLENQEEQAVWENRVVSVNPAALVVVGVHQVPRRRVVRAAAFCLCFSGTSMPQPEFRAAGSIGEADREHHA